MHCAGAAVLSVTLLLKQQLPAQPWLVMCYSSHFFFVPLLNLKLTFETKKVFIFAGNQPIFFFFRILTSKTLAFVSVA